MGFLGKVGKSMSFFRGNFSRKGVSFFGKTCFCKTEENDEISRSRKSRFWAKVEKSFWTDVKNPEVKMQWGIWFFGNRVQ